MIISAVVAIGIGGLSGYWIEQRRKAIAIRRALGARRRQIALYFHAENLLVTLSGCFIGGAGAWYLSQILARWLSMPPLSLAALLATLLFMLLLGQFSVWLPLRSRLRAWG